MVSDPRTQLLNGVSATMNAGYLVRMVTLAWDPAGKNGAGRKHLVVPPPAGWHNGPQSTPEEIVAAVQAGANAYLYRLPQPDTWVVDTDNPETTAEMTHLLGPCDVVTGSGGAHWLVDAPLERRPGIDTEPYQLYGPGSFYPMPDGTVRVYTGVVPSSPRPLPSNLPRKAGKTRPAAAAPTGPAHESALDAYLSQRDLKATSIPRALARAAELLHEIVTGPDDGDGARMAINNASLYLGGLIAAGVMDHATAAERLIAACDAKWGSASEADRQWIEVGLSDGVRKPVEVYDPAEAPPLNGANDPWTAAGGPSGGAPYDPACDVVDQSMAESLARWMYPGARYDYRSGLYYQRHGLVPGQSDDDKRSIWRAVDSKINAPRAFVAQAARHLPPSEDSPYYKLHSTSKTAGSIAAKFTDVVNLPGHYFAQGLHDHPDVLWCAGVPWDLRTAQPASLPLGTPHAQHGPVSPADVPTPAWDAWLELVWPDPEVREWALRVLAVAFTGRSPSVVPVLHGVPGSGKTVTIDTLMKTLSPAGKAERDGYAHSTVTELLDTGAGGAHSEAVLNLQGRRLVYLDEGPPRNTRAEVSHVEAFKRFTAGSGTLSVAGKYRSQVTFTPTHTIVMTTNNPPDLSDDGVLRRARVLPCPADPAATPAAAARLAAVFEQEAPGILLGMIRRAALFLADPSGLDRYYEPLTIRERTQDLADSADVVAEWVRDHTVPDPVGMKSSTVRDAFSTWRRNHPHWSGQRALKDSEIYARLDKLGYPVERRKDANYRCLRTASTGDVSWAVSPQGAGGVEALASTKTSASTSASTPETAGHGGAGGSGGGGGGTSIKTPPVTTPQTMINRALVEKGKGAASTPPPAPPTHSVPVPTPAQPVPGEVITCPWCREPATLTKSIKLKVHKDPTGSRCMGSGEAPPGVPALRERKASDRAAATRAKVTEAAGPLLTLPAAMRRGEGPREVDLAGAAAVLEACLARNGGRLAVDVETNGLPLWSPEWACQTIQLGDWAEAVDLDAGDPAHRQIAAAYLAAATELEAYSYTADLVPLARLGVIEYADALAKCIDVATIVKLSDPALTENGDGLKETSKAVLGAAAVSPGAEAAREALGSAAGWIWKLKPDTPREKNGWAQIDKRCAVMVAYALADVLDCSALRIKLPQPDPAVMAREIVAERVVAKLPYLGLALDGPAVRAQLDDREPRAAAKLTRIRELGVDNPDSPKQVTTRLVQLGAILPRTKPSKTAPEGNPTAAKDVLEKLTHAPGELGELATTLLEYRDDATVLKNMIRPWARSTEHGDGRTYPTIYTLGADTGRMSCVRPNLQQVAREGGLRECIVADPGFLLIAADFSSVEVRVAAYLSGDQNLIRMINGALTCPTCLAGQTCVLHDLHAMIANQAYGPGFTKANRYNVKRVVFGRLYGGSAPTLAAQTGISIEMVERLVATLDALAPQLAAWSAQLRQAVKNGLREFRTYSGRVIHLDPRLPHKAPNFAVQGTARELLVDALIRWEQGPYAGGIVLPVHDEIVAMVKAEDAPAATAFLERCMVTQLGPVPITVEADEPAERWQSAA